MRKIASVNRAGLVFVAGLLALAACSSGAQSGTGSTAGAKSSTSQTPTANGSATPEASASTANGPSAELIAKAKGEGTLLFYCTASQDKMTAWVKAFTDKYGIKVQIYRAPSNPLYQRFVQEAQAGKVQADVIQLSDLTQVKSAIDKEYYANYTPSTASLYSNDTVVPGYAYPMYITLSAVGWNTAKVPADLQKKLDSADTLDALLDPRMKGKVAVVDVAAGGPELASNSDIVYKMQDKYGWAYLEKLAKQNPGVARSSVTLSQKLVAGDYWAVLDGYSSVIGPLAVSGAPVAYRPFPTSSGSVFYLSVVNKANHPNAARLFEEWATTVEAQSSLANITQGDVTVKGWVDQRKVSKEPWFASPGSVWFGWATDPRLQGDQLKQFYDKWHGLFGKAGS